MVAGRPRRDRVRPRVERYFDADGALPDFHAVELDGRGLGARPALDHDARDALAQARDVALDLTPKIRTDRVGLGQRKLVPAKSCNQAPEALLAQCDVKPHLRSHPHLTDLAEGLHCGRPIAGLL
jgi:hypothetical protein